MSTVNDAPIPPDLDLEAILANKNVEKLAFDLAQFPRLDPRDPLIVTIAAQLPENQWTTNLIRRLEFLKTLNPKAVEKIQKRRLKVAQPLGNLFFEEDQAEISDAPVEAVAAVADEVVNAATVPGQVTRAAAISAAEHGMVEGGPVAITRVVSAVTVNTDPSVGKAT